MINRLALWLSVAFLALAGAGLLYGLPMAMIVPVLLFAAVVGVMAYLSYAYLLRKLDRADRRRDGKERPR